MYEEFRHPTYKQALDFLDTKLAERRLEIEAYLTANSIPITDEIIEVYYRGYRKRLIRQIRPRVKRTGLYAFAELPVSFLDLQVPNAFPKNQKPVATGIDTDPNGVEYTVYSLEQMTFREYLVIYHESLDGTKVLFAMAGRPYESERGRQVGEAELGVWKSFLEGRGFDWANARGLDAYRTRLGGPLYTP